VAGGFKIADAYVDVEVNEDTLDAAIAAAQAKLAAIKDRAVAVGLSKESMTALAAQIKAVNGMLANLKGRADISLNASELIAQIAAIQKLMDSIQTKFNIQVDTKDLSSAFKDVALSATAAGVAVVTMGDRTEQTLGTLFPVMSQWIQGWGVMRGNVQLFAGVLTQLGLPAFIASASALHLIVDSAFELASVLIPATIGIIAFGLAAAPTLDDIATKMRAVWVTSTALQTTIYPLSGAFAQMENAVKPDVIEGFGEALVLVNDKTGEFIALARQAGTVILQLETRMVTALDSSGLSQFTKNAAQDLSLLGNIIGNIFGIIGNLLHAVPGYAQVLFQALQNFTGALEAITSNPIVQWILQLGLAVHGALLWLGLGATAAVYFGNALIGLAAKFGLAEEGALAFDSIQFGTGLLLMFSYVGDLAVALVTFAGAEDIATAATGSFDAALIVLDAVNPLVWVGAVAVALGALIYWLTRSTSATQSYNTAVNSALQNAPVSQFSIDLTKEMSATIGQLSIAQVQLANTAKPLAGGTPQQIERSTAAYQAQVNVVKGYQGELQTLQTYQGNYNTLLKASGNNLSFLNTAGITSNMIVGASAQQLKEYVIEVKAAADAQEALGLGTGRAAAAQNAQTNIFMTETVPALQKVTQAETAVITMITGGQLAVDNFQQGMDTLAQNFIAASGSGATVTYTLDHIKSSANSAGAALTGTSQASYALNQAFYQQINNAQSAINSLQGMGASTSDLTPIIGTMAAQMKGFAGNNVEANSTIVALINNALGPGTVSLQTLNGWLKTNSTTLQGMDADVAKITIDAAAFAGVLNQDVNAALSASIIQAEGGQKAFDQFATGVYTGNTASNTFKASGVQVISMLLQQSGNSLPKTRKAFEDYTNSLGLSKGASDALWTSLKNQLLDQTATKAGETRSAFVQFATQLGLTKKGADNLWDSLHKLTGGSPYKLSLTETGQGTFIINGNVAPTPSGGVPLTTAVTHPAHAAGGRILLGTTPTADDVLIRVSKGETVLSAYHSAILAPHLKRLGVPGYAAGGVPNISGQISALAGATQSDWQAFVNQMTQAMETAMTSAMKTAQAAAQAAASAGGGVGSGAVANSAQIAAIAAAHGITGAQLTALLQVIARESGGSTTAKNPTSGAYGIAQFINGPSEYAQYGGNVGTVAGQVTAMINYILQRYGSPEAAEAHEVAYGWYDKGGMIPPGLTLVSNMTKQNEMVLPGAVISQFQDSLIAIPHPITMLTSAIKALTTATAKASSTAAATTTATTVAKAVATAVTKKPSAPAETTLSADEKKANELRTQMASLWKLILAEAKQGNTKTAAANEASYRKMQASLNSTEAAIKADKQVITELKAQVAAASTAAKAVREKIAETEKQLLAATKDGNTAAAAKDARNLAAEEKQLTAANHHLAVLEAEAKAAGATSTSTSSTAKKGVTPVAVTSVAASAIQYVQDKAAEASLHNIKSDLSQQVQQQLVIIAGLKKLDTDLGQVLAAIKANTAAVAAAAKSSASTAQKARYPRGGT
jgi:hypothetical protein